MIWQGVSFPDGMMVLEGPFPGFNTDTVVWRDSEVRADLELIMQSRMAKTPPRRRLKLYVDKIYNTSALVTAAFSLRHGPLEQWMVAENFLMSKLRVAVEWTYGTIIDLAKFLDFRRGQKLQESPLPKHYTVAALLANCHCFRTDIR